MSNGATQTNVLADMTAILTSETTVANLKEECRYVWTDEDGGMKEVPEDEVSDCCDSGLGTVMKIIRHGNGKITVHNAVDNDKILEM